MLFATKPTHRQGAVGFGGHGSVQYVVLVYSGDIVPDWIEHAAGREEKEMNRQALIRRFPAVAAGAILTAVLLVLFLLLNDASTRSYASAPTAGRHPIATPYATSPGALPQDWPLPQITDPSPQHWLRRITFTLTADDYTTYHNETYGVYGEGGMLLPRDAEILEIEHTGGSYEIQVHYNYITIDFRDLQGYTKIVYRTQSFVTYDGKDCTLTWEKEVHNGNRPESADWEISFYYPVTYTDHITHIWPSGYTHEPGRISWAASYGKGGGGLNLQIDFAFCYRPVLLVHGYCSSAAMWGPLDGPIDFKHALEDRGFPVETIDLGGSRPANGDIWSYAHQLAAKINEMKRQYDVDQVDIVAHSMGGLVARAYALLHRSSRDVNTLIMLGTPNNGSGLCYSRYWRFLRNLLTAHELLSGKLPCQFRGVAGTQMAPRSRFLRTLNSIGLQPSIENYYTIAGYKPLPITSRLLWGLDDGVVTVGSVHAIPATTDYLLYLDHFEYDDVYFVLNLIVSILRGTTPSAATLNHVQQSDTEYQESALIEDLVTVGSGNIHSIPIDPTVSEVHFVLASDGEELDFTLTSPGGTRITPIVAASDPSIAYTNAITTLMGYGITHPQPGQWTAHVAISGTASSEVGYAMLALMDTDLGLSILLDEKVYHVGNPVPLMAQLVNTSTPTTEATLVAQIECPDGSREAVPLYDDGLHGDGEASDGVYSNLYTDTTVAGAYYITVTASGTMDDEQFVRETATTIWVDQSVYLPFIGKNSP